MESTAIPLGAVPTSIVPLTVAGTGEGGRVTTVRLSFAVVATGGLAESATCTVKLKRPPAVGVPEMVPLLSKLSPAGKELPEARLHVKGAIPPDSCKVALYALPPVAFCSNVVVTVGGGNTVTESEADFVLSAAEVAVMLADTLAATGLGAM